MPTMSNVTNKGKSTRSETAANTDKSSESSPKENATSSSDSSANTGNASGKGKSTLYKSTQSNAMGSIASKANIGWLKAACADIVLCIFIGVIIQVHHLTESDTPSCLA